MPQRDGQDGFERPASLFELFNKLQDFKKFRKTINAVLRGEPLYDYDKRRLEDDGYLGPWKVNVLQSTLSGLPAIFIPWCGHLLGLSAAAGESDDKLFDVLQSFGLPFVLMLTAYVVGRASLWKRDATQSAKGRAGRIFLYLDAAYGLWPQLLGSAVLSLYFLMPDWREITKTAIMIGSALQLQVYMMTIPDQLFQALGYTEYVAPLAAAAPLTLFPVEAKPTVETGVSRADPPKWKYRVCVLVVLPAIAVGVSVGLYAISLGLRPILRILAL